MNFKFNLDTQFNSYSFLSFRFACMWWCHIFVYFCMHAYTNYFLAVNKRMHKAISRTNQYEWVGPNLIPTRTDARFMWWFAKPSPEAKYNRPRRTLQWRRFPKFSLFSRPWIGPDQPGMFFPSTKKKSRMAMLRSRLDAYRLLSWQQEARFA